MSARIVVIDDEPEVCELLGKVLLRAGFDVVCAPDAAAGLALLEAGEVRCLVVDKQLPGRSGLEVMAEARRRWPRVATVLVSSQPEPFTLEEARPEVVLSRPFASLGAIEDAVQEALALTSRTTLDQLRERVEAVVAEIAPGLRKRE